MKLVKEHINEKFSEDSDPIRDMGIGGFNLGRIRHKLKQDYKEKFMQTFKDLLVGKTITGRFNEALIYATDPDTGKSDIKNGRGWGTYTIYVDEIMDRDLDDDSASIMVYDEKKRAAYMIPFEDKKIFYENS